MFLQSIASAFKVVALFLYLVPRTLKSQGIGGHSHYGGTTTKVLFVTRRGVFLPVGVRGSRERAAVLCGVCDRPWTMLGTTGTSFLFATRLRRVFVTLVGLIIVRTLVGGVLCFLGARLLMHQVFLAWCHIFLLDLPLTTWGYNNSPCVRWKLICMMVSLCDSG